MSSNSGFMSRAYDGRSVTRLTFALS